MFNHIHIYFRSKTSMNMINGLYLIHTFFKFLSKKIVPPPSLKVQPKLVRGTVQLANCIEQRVSHLDSNGDFFSLSYDHTMNLTLKQFKERSAEFEMPGLGLDEIEDTFWQKIKSRSCSANEPNPIYSIDNEKTLFPTEWAHWNLNKIDSVVSIIHQKPIIKGVNTSYVYFGMAFTSFGFHHEDCDVGSINILHDGSPKSWYSVPSSYAKELEKLVRDHTPASVGCDLFINHKTVMVPPSVLLRAGIPFGKVI